MSEATSWYDKFSSLQLIFLGFLLLGATPLIRNPEYFDILTDRTLWNSPEMSEVLKAIFIDGCIGALAGGWFAFRKYKK